MHPLVKINYTSPTMNTHSYKKAICAAVEPSYEDDFEETDNVLHYFSLLNSLNNNIIIQVLQNNTATYQLEQYGDEMVNYWKEVKREIVGEGNRGELENKQSCWSR